MAINNSLRQRLTLSRVFALIFNFFALLFAAFMGLDFFEYRFGLSELAFLILAGTFLIIALLSFFIGRRYKPETYQSCPNCGVKISLFQKWHCVSCDNYQKKERYIVEKCDTCGKSSEIITCPRCKAEVDPNELLGRS